MRLATDGASETRRGASRIRQYPGRQQIDEMIFAEAGFQRHVGREGVGGAVGLGRRRGRPALVRDGG